MSQINFDDFDTKKQCGVQSGEKTKTVTAKRKSMTDYVTPTNDDVMPTEKGKKMNHNNSNNWSGVAAEISSEIQSVDRKANDDGVAERDVQKDDEKPAVTGYPVTCEVFNITTFSSKVSEGYNNKYDVQIVGCLDDDAVPVVLEGNFIGTQQVSVSGRNIVDVTSSSRSVSACDVTSGGLSGGGGAAVASGGKRKFNDVSIDSEPSTSGCKVDSKKKKF